MYEQAILFDLDGTLLDTLDDLADACNYALRSVGAPERTRGEVRAFVGNGLGRLLERALPGGRAHPRYAEALTTLQAYYQSHNQVKTQPYEGIPELLTALRDRGALLGVVSNKPDPSVKQLCARYFPGLFPVAIGEQPGVRRKPAPDTVLTALRALGADAESAVYIGDSEVDLKTAENAGLPCVSVTWGFREPETLLEAGAEVLAASPEELLALLEDGGEPLDLGYL